MSGSALVAAAAAAVAGRWRGRMQGREYDRSYGDIHTHTQTHTQDMERLASTKQRKTQYMHGTGIVRRVNVLAVRRYKHWTKFRTTSNP
jgi:hypothetical protein